jgi:hypothetical protein
MKDRTWTWILLGLGWGLAGLFGARLLIGCGGQAFTTLDVTAAHVDAGDVSPAAVLEHDAGDDAAAIAPPADAGDEETHVVMTTAVDAGVGDGSRVELEHDASADVVDDAGPRVCQPDRCPPCSAAQGYACCTVAGVCGCENPSAGGYCL